MAPAYATVMPNRIVSLNLCTDQILVDLVPRERIAAVSHLAADPLVSAVAEKARGIPWTRGEAEVVLSFAPDLVIAGEYTTPATVALLERLGLKVMKIPLASDIAGLRAVTYQIADAVGARDTADALLAEFERRLRAVAVSAVSNEPTAVVYQVNGLAAGPGSLADSVLRAAGLRNLAGELGLGPGGQLALEALVAKPPDLIILSGPVNEYRAAVADNLRHPALATIMRAHASVTLPWRLWLCATPHLADAIERLAVVRDDIARSRAVR
ncbi:MAG: ABC transporter substrate-binding protein [Hyphomicrobiaceae bacterium]